RLAPMDLGIMLVSVEKIGEQKTLRAWPLKLPDAASVHRDFLQARRTGTRRLLDRAGRRTIRPGRRLADLFHSPVVARSVVRDPQPHPMEEDAGRHPFPDDRRGGCVIAHRWPPLRLVRGVVGKNSRTEIPRAAASFSRVATVGLSVPA